MGLSDREHRYRPAPRAWYRSTWLTTLVVVGFVAVLAALVVIPVWATDTPTYCMSCKATQPAGRAWEQSTHANVSCVQCHVPPGFASAVKWRSREWLNIWADYLNVPRVPSKGSRPGNANCLKCHSLKRIPERSGGIRMPHQVHVDLRDLTCADCHSQVAHPKAGTTGTGVSMAVCSMCHNKDGAPADCSFCHITPPSKNVHPKDYLQTHGRQALADEASCMRCHHSKAAVLRPVPPASARRPLLGHVEVHARRRRREGSTQLYRLPRQGDVLRAVPSGAAPRRLAADARRRRRQERRRLLRVPSSGHVRALSRATRGASRPVNARRSFARRSSS